jgi:glycosyltransferase involved in cell wall biosynthesis
MKNNSVWITWENQRRNREVSRALKVPCFELAEVDEMKNLMKKYTYGLTKTFRILLKNRPRIIFCQNPSLVLAFSIVTTKTLLGAKVVVDAHNAGIYPKEGASKLLGLLARFVQRRADLTIVSNEALKSEVEKNGGVAFALQDKIPDIPIGRPRKLKGKINFLYICSFAEDEPYGDVFQAARLLDSDICIYVSGNYHKRGIRPDSLTDNIVLTGFLPESEYIEMLNSVDATIVLTQRENCLLCGAYESVAIGKPMILSNTEILREYFNGGAIYTENIGTEIEKSIRELILRKEELGGQLRQIKVVREGEWAEKKSHLERMIWNG